MGDHGRKAQIQHKNIVTSCGRIDRSSQKKSAREEMKSHGILYRGSSALLERTGLIKDFSGKKVDMR